MCNDGLFVVSLPRLIDFDWRVDVKTSSDSVMRMAVPTCLVQMKVSDVDLVKSSLCLHFHCQIRTLLILCWSSVAILEKTLWECVVGFWGGHSAILLSYRLDL